jgi:hypothetical protein
LEEHEKTKPHECKYLNLENKLWDYFEFMV